MAVGVIHRFEMVNIGQCQYKGLIGLSKFVTYLLGVFLHGAAVQHLGEAVGVCQVFEALCVFVFAHKQQDQNGQTK